MEELYMHHDDEFIQMHPNMLKVLALSYRLSIAFHFSCVTDLACFAALNSLPESPLYRRLIYLGFTEDEIHQNVANLINEYQVTCHSQKPYKLICPNPNAPGFFISEQLAYLFEIASSIAENYYDTDAFGCNELLAAMAENMPIIYEDFLRKCGIYPEANHSALEKEVHTMKIPHDLAGCLRVLNDKYSPDETTCQILERDKETRRLIRILSKDTKRNAILVGEPGVGKTALVEKFTWMIVTSNCPDKFKDSIVVSLDVNAIVANTQYRGSAEARFEELVYFLESEPNCILFIDEIHTVLGAGACRDGELDLADVLKPILARGDTRVIGATTSEEYLKYFSQDGALKRRFERINVKEPKAIEVYPMIKNQIAKLSKSHGTTISKELIDMVIFYASCFNYETRNPDRSLDLIDTVMATAELNGKQEVCKEDILENFDTNKEIFRNTPAQVKKALAYHEAGHYIVHRFSNELYDHKILAVSILPAEGYLGVNVFEIDTDVIPSASGDYYLQLIACKLGGRIAELMYSSNYTAGASADLENATRMAKNVVTKYGLSESLSPYRMYLDDANAQMYSDKMRDTVNDEIDLFLKKSAEYAQALLEEHTADLKKLVEALLERGMLSADEIDALLAS